MKILITGANGFIGRHLIRRLQKDGMKIIALVREVPSDTVENMNYLHANLKDKSWLKKLPDDISCIVHLAQSMRYREFPAGADDMFKVNIESTFRLLEWARKSGVRSFIYASTGNVYKATDKLIEETFPCEPDSMYGATKLSAENLVRQYRLFFRTVILRIFGVYGPGQKNMLIPNMISNIQNKKQLPLAGGIGLKFTPLYIKDSVEMIEQILTDFDTKDHDCFNLCGDEIITLDNVVKQIAEFFELDPQINELKKEPASFSGSNLKFKTRYGFQPAMKFSQGLKEVLNHFHE